MTTARVLEVVPFVSPDAYETGRTVRAAHGVDLANLANFAALGHPSQVLHFGKILDEGTYSAYFTPLPGVVDYLVLAGWLQFKIYDTGATCNLTIKVYDLSGNSYSAPAPFDGTFEFRPGRDVPRNDAATSIQGIFSVDAMVAAGLDTSDDSWRFEVDVNYTVPYVPLVGPHIILDGLTVFELPRRTVNTADPYGVLPGAFLPLAPIVDVGQVQGVLKALEGAYNSSLRTYLSLAVSEENGALYTTQGAVDGSLDNLEETGTTPITFWCRPRYLRGTTSRFRFQVRYKVNGDDAEVKITTAAGSYTITLVDSGGAWADSTVGTGYFTCTGPGDTDSMVVTGSAVAGACTLSAITVWEYPE